MRFVVVHIRTLSSLLVIDPIIGIKKLAGVNFLFVEKTIILLTLSILTGLLVAIMYMIFEFVANDGTEWLWNTVVNSDQYRWRVIPLAIIMSVIY